MESSFWHERWQKGDIGFHRDTPHPSLEQHWHSLAVAAPAIVFVPLCGKSLDMAWLAGKGYRVRGVELSQIAIDDFFAGQDLTPATRSEGPFTVSKAGPFELWCGDLFALPSTALDDVDAIYDRASLIALPPPTQAAYAKWLSTTLGTAPILLISLAYNETEMNGPPFSIPEQQIRRLFADSFQLDVLSNKEVLDDNPGLRKRGLSAITETVYRVRRK